MRDLLEIQYGLNLLRSADSIKKTQSSITDVLEILLKKGSSGFKTTECEACLDTAEQLGLHGRCEGLIGCSSIYSRDKTTDPHCSNARMAAHLVNMKGSEGDDGADGLGCWKGNVGDLRELQSALSDYYRELDSFDLIGTEDSAFGMPSSKTARLDTALDKIMHLKKPEFTSSTDGESEPTRGFSILDDVFWRHFRWSSDWN
jgi:hypothetical protein